ncbi:MAG: hypothetical protein IMZ61_04710 [Planctomycetes bacterium]|nr:hypothetical protein [Planctomycetota bacterium]
MSGEHFFHTEYGYCYYTLDEHPIIYGLFVEPEDRRVGHGKWLIEEAIKAIRLTGYAGPIGVEAIPEGESIGRESLVSFYEKQGLTIMESPEALL